MNRSDRLFLLTVLLVSILGLTTGYFIFNPRSSKKLFIKECVADKFTDKMKMDNYSLYKSNLEQICYDKWKDRK